MSYYDSDTSTLVDDDHPRGQRRHQRRRSPSRDQYGPRPPYPDQDYYKSPLEDYGMDKSKLMTAGKVAIVVGLVGLLVHKWRKEREEREREHRHRRRRDFERAKRARRREEERREREEEEELAQSRSPPQMVRRIEYMPLSPRDKSRPRPADGDRDSDTRSERSGRSSPADMRDGRRPPRIR